MIGQLHSVVIDAPDAHALATFYAQLLGMEVTKGSPGDDWIVVTGAGHRIAFQHAPDLVRPDWPDPDRPQQFHLNFDVGPLTCKASPSQPPTCKNTSRRFPSLTVNPRRPVP